MKLPITNVQLKCFAKQPKVNMAECLENIRLPQDWFDQLNKRVLTVNSLEAPSKTLNTHASTKASYSAKNSLRESLRFIYAGLQGQLKSKGVVVDETSTLLKIREGLNQCTPGFHNRVNGIIANFSVPKSIDELLQEIRQSLVNRAARGISDEVHAHNNFSIVADREGYGVHPINASDPHRGGIEDNTIVDTLNETFAAHYTPFQIMQSLYEAIVGMLNDPAGPIGTKDKDGHYTTGEYEKFLDFLIQLKLAKKDNRYEYLVLDDDSHVTGFNWEKIKLALWTRMNVGRYVHFNKPQIKKVLRIIYGRDKAADPIDVSGLFESLEQCLSFINYFDFLSDELKGEVILSYLKETQHLNDEELMSTLILTAEKPNINGYIIASIEKKYPNAFRQLMERKLMVHDSNGCNPLINAMRSSTQTRKLKILLLGFTHLYSFVQGRLLQEIDPSQNNALMTAVSYQPDAVPTLLSCLKNQRIEVQNEVLKQVNIEGYNAIMLAARFHPSALPLLLASIKNLPSCDRSRLLKQANNDGFNAIMLAIENHPSALPALFPYIKELHPNVQIAIFEQVNRSGWNAVMFATLRKPELMMALLESIEKLDLNNRAAILKRTDNEGWNALIHAARNQGQLVPILLASIEKLLPYHREHILTKTTSSGNNALTYAIWDQADAVHALLESTVKLSLEAQSRIFEQSTDNGSNALITAARHNPHLIPDLLASIERLPLEVQSRILTHADNEGRNVLMLTANREPNLILSSISKLSLSDQARILEKTDKNGSNALMLAVMNNPESVPAFIANLSHLSPATQLRILRQKTNAGNNALQLAIKYQPIVIPALLTTILDLPELELKKFPEFSHFTKDDWNAALKKTENQLAAVLRLASLIIANDLSTSSGAYVSLRENLVSQLKGNAETVHRLFNNSSVRALLHKSDACLINWDKADEAATILKSIAKLSVEAQSRIFEQSTDDGSNALITTARHNPHLIPDLLASIERLPLDVQSRILTQTDDEGRNVLMLTANREPQPILASISKLSPADQARILEKTNLSGSNALMLAAMNNPESVPAFIASLSNLCPELIVSFLKGSVPVIF